MRPHTVCRLFHFKNRPLNLSKSEQFASPEGKLLPCLKTLFTTFLVLLAQFSQIISGEKHSLSSFTPTRISKFHASWRLTCMQTRNFKDFLNTLYKSCFFRSWRDTHPGNNFLWGQVISIFTPSSHWQLFISVCCQTTYQTDVMNNFLRTKIIQKEFNLLQMEQVDSWLHPSLVCERFLALWCSLTSPLVASLTSSQIYKHILALKEFSQTTCICLFRKKAFQFELLFYCLLFAKLLLWILTCLTWAQLSHIQIRIGPIMRWSHILVTLMDIRTSFCARICKRNIPINGLDDVLASCNAG